MLGRGFATVLACLVGLSNPSNLHAQVAVVGPYYRVVESGQPLQIDAFAVMNPDCTVVGEPKINLVDAPWGGEVSIGKERLYPNYPITNARFACDRRRVGHTAIRYRSVAGFVGADQFTIELVLPNGLARKERYFFQVRPGSSSASRSDIAPSKQAVASCANERALSSLSSGVGTRISFINHTGEPRAVYWLDFQGARVPYGTLGPGQKLELKTYLTHPWVIADSSARCLRVVLPSASGNAVAIR